MNILTGLAPAAPTRLYLGDGADWISVDVGINEVNPVAIARSSETLELGGGTVLWPGDHASLFTDELWMRSPLSSGRPFVCVELQAGPSHLARDPFGVLQSTSAAKLMNAPVELDRPEHAGGRKLAPGKWHNLSGTIIGTYGIGLRSHGGDVLVGTHMAINKGDGTQYHPDQLPLTAGSATKLTPGVWQWFPGNHVWYAWTDDQGVSVELWKLERGRSFV